MDHPDDPTVPRPCPVPVSTMEPHEKGHRCRDCDTLVLDSALHTRSEFLALVRRGGKVCAQLRADGTGRVRFADSLKRRLSVVAFSAAMAACGEDHALPPEPAEVTEPRDNPDPGMVRAPSTPPPDVLPPSFPADPGLVVPPRSDETPTASTDTASTGAEPAEPIDPPASESARPHTRGRAAPPRGSREETEDGLVGLVGLEGL